MVKNILIFLFVITAGFNVQAQTQITLQQAIEMGIKNNLEVDQSGLLLKKEEIGWKQSRALMLPDLNVNVTHGINHGRSIDPFTNSYINQNVNYANYGASSSVLVSQGGSLQNRIKSDKLSYEAAGLEWQQAKDNVTINIILAYLQILSAEEVLQQSKMQATVSSRQIERLKILNEQGAIAPSEFYDLKGQVAEEQLAIANNEANVVNAKLLLSQYLNIPYDRNMEVARLPESSFAMDSVASPETVYASTLQNFARVKAVHLRSLSAEKAVSSAKGMLFPVLSLGGNINTNYSSAATRPFFLNSTEVASTDYVNVNGDKIPVMIQQNNFDNRKINYGDQLNNNLFNSIYLTLSIPVFNASQARNRIRLAKIDLENNRLVEKQTKTELQQEVEKAYVAVNTALKKYRILQEQVSAFTESFRAADVKFNAGAINSVDYLIAKNNLDNANINLIIAKYDFVLRGKVLDYYSGINVQR